METIPLSYQADAKCGSFVFFFYFWFLEVAFFFKFNFVLQVHVIFPCLKKIN